jgi:hypothetical protein
MIALFDAEALLDGRRSAVLAPATDLDQIRLVPDGPCCQLSDVAVGTEVSEVNIVGRDLSQVGVEKSIRSLKTGRRYPLLVTSIRLVDCKALVPGDLAALGYASHADFEHAWRMLNTARGWLIRLTPPSATPILPE